MNKRAAKIGLGIVTIFACIVGSLFVLPLHPAVAAPSDTSIMKKTLANAIKTCYNSSYVEKDITPAGQFTTEDIFVYHFLNKNKGTVLVLDSLGGTINCEQVFLGSNKVQGLNSLFSKNPTTPVSLGYEKSGEDNPSSTRCMQMKYKHKSADTGYMVEYTSNSLCFGVMSDGIVDMNSFPSGGVPGFECVDPICLSANIQGKVFVNWLDNDGIHREWEVAYFDTNSFAGGDGTKWDDLYKAVTDEVSVMGSDQGYANVSMSQTKTDDPGAFASYTITSYSKAAEAAFKYYTGSSNMDSQKFNSEDVVYLLEKAYAKMRDVDKIITEDSKCFTGKDEALNQGTAYAHYNEGKKMWCPVFLNTGTAAGKTYNVVGNTYKDLFAASPERVLELLTNRNLGYATAGDMCVENARKRYDEFDQAWKDEDAKGENKDSTKLQYYKEQQKVIRQMLNKAGGTYKTENGQVVCLNLPTIDGAPETPPPTEDDNDGGTTPPSPDDNSASANPTSDIAQCLNNASSLGWILCPVLKFVGVAADGLWNEVANNWLVTDYTTYKADKNNSVYVAWSNIRNLTNIVFAIMLGIIIVSQLTGVGISNYGIKKILPTLVMTIVLVNISFLICQLLIDVSNVIGGSVESIADTMRQQISEASGVGFGDIFRGTLGSLFNIAGIGILSGAAFYTISTEGAAVLIPLLIAVIGVIISIIFAFVILAVRQAIILVSVVISPLAIICYALPNTKSLYDKWRKIFTTSLFIYPVCAVCIYGGQVVSSLMLASNHTGFMYNLVAMLLQIVPIFFIPSLIRGAMTLAGNIGNRVAQMGNNLRNSATGSLSKSDTAERLRMEGQYQAAQHNRGLFDRLSQRKGLLGAIGRAGGRKLDSNIGKYNEMRLKDYQSQLYASNPRSLTTALSAAKQNHIDKLAKDIALENTDIATNDGALQVKHAEALAAYNANQTEENLASVQAYQDMLIESGDGGRQLMFDNYARAAQSGLGTALRDGAKHAIRAHSKDIKSNNRDMYAMLTQYAGGGDLMAGSFRPYLDAKGSEHMISSHFANKGIESYDAQSLAKMDEGSLDRLVEQARHNDLNTVAVGKLESLTHEAITNKTISIQGKIEDKLNDLREAMGYERISRRKSDDSGTINVHSGDSGTVLRTGNDDRPTSPASPAPTTAIPGYREAQNWRPNADASGIILPPGFKK